MSAGLVAGLLAMGVSILSAALIARATRTSGVPTWLWRLAIAALRNNEHATSFVATGVGVLVVLVGICAGLASGWRQIAGTAVFVVAGGWGVGVIRILDSATLNLLVPMLAALTGIVFLLIARPRPAADPVGEDLVAPERPVARRAVLAGGLLAAAALAGTGLLVTPAAGQRPLEAVRTNRVAGADRAGAEPRTRGEVFDVRDFGAAGDGRRDDAAAVQKALEAANAVGGTVFFPAGVYRYASREPIRPADGVSLAGENGRSTVQVVANGNQGFSVLCVIEADDVVLDGLTFTRVDDIDSVFVGLSAFATLTLSRMTFDGSLSALPDRSCHAVLLSDSGRSSGLTIVDSTFTDMQYGLLQTNASTGALAGVVVERCAFQGGTNTHLEFNGPKGALTDITVQDCTFTDNDSDGFGVGLAKVTGAVVRRNTFEQFEMEAVHIEDYTTDVTVVDNEFVSCALRSHAYVQIIGRSSEVRVLENSFDARANTEQVFVVAAQAGGTGRTPSGRETGPPTGVEVRDNVMLCSDSVVPLYFENAPGSSVTGNIIVGEGILGPEAAFELHDAEGAVEIVDNTVNGARI